ncbi:RnfABCDGE type electron transport complex subunit E [Clostridium bovifaecis]|uniref:Ion-translocating oxidoreductase complex subunit E n=1 Tax=Clostridium bovifaecis TaxID=2184719 RepID=A0A6I6F3P1_9CLOT|nr:RnfABCDGE type electron transport complex subunit E [Clostridium bovifaecis]
MGVLIERLKNGIFTENTIFVQVLAMCPTLAVTSSAINGIGMGLASTVVLMGANFVISLLRNVIPDKVRIPGFIVVIAGFVTLLQFLLAGFVPALNKSLGIFIPLIVVNCVILGRAEAYASKNTPIPSIFDGLGMGLGFTLSLTVIGMVRELLGTGKLFGAQIMPKAVDPALIFVLAPGAFITLGIMMALLNQRNINKKKAK